MLRINNKPFGSLQISPVLIKLLENHSNLFNSAQRKSRMADPISATIGLFCTALQAGGAIAEYNQKHKERKARRDELARSKAQSLQEPGIARVIAAYSYSEPKDCNFEPGDEIVVIGKLDDDWWFGKNLRNGIEGCFPANYVRAKSSPQVTLSSPSVPTTGYDEEEAVEELFLVLGTLGQRLLALEAINQTHLPTTSIAVSQALSRVSKHLGTAFGELGKEMQYATTCAVIFCVACYPMHIYRGFGCGVLDKPGWGAHPDNTLYSEEDISTTLVAMDRALAYLKTVPNSLELLVKQPVGVDKDTPTFEAYESDSDEAEEWLTAVCNGYVNFCETNGFPQPKDKRLVITRWGFAFATWNGSSLYGYAYHNMRACSRYQQDPGRYLYAWIVWNRLDLQPQEALLCDEVTLALASWLQGLKGMTHKVLRDDDFDLDALKFPAIVQEFSMKMYGNTQMRTGGNSCIVREPGFSLSSTSQITKTSKCLFF